MPLVGLPNAMEGRGSQVMKVNSQRENMARAKKGLPRGSRQCGRATIIRKKKKEGCACKRKHHLDRSSNEAQQERRGEEGKK